LWEKSSGGQSAPDRIIVVADELQPLGEARKFRTGEGRIREVQDLKKPVGVDHEQSGFREGAVSFPFRARLRDIKPEVPNLIQGKAVTDRKGDADLVCEAAGAVLGIAGDRDDANARPGEFGPCALKLRKIGLADRAVLAALNHNHLPVMIVHRLAKLQVAAAEARHDYFGKAFAGFELVGHRHLLGQ